MWIALNAHYRSEPEAEFAESNDHYRQKHQRDLYNSFPIRERQNQIYETVFQWVQEDLIQNLI